MTVPKLVWVRWKGGVLLKYKGRKSPQPEDPDVSRQDTDTGGVRGLGESELDSVGAVPAAGLGRWGGAVEVPGLWTDKGGTYPEGVGRAWQTEGVKV